MNKCCGDLQYTSAHLAAFNNNTEIMSLLMKYGADMEIRNSENLPPIALTSSYDIRFKIRFICIIIVTGNCLYIMNIFSMHFINSLFWIH